jgi:hypothetical protein
LERSTGVENNNAIGTNPLQTTLLITLWRTTERLTFFIGIIEYLRRKIPEKIIC